MKHHCGAVWDFRHGVKYPLAFDDGLGIDPMVIVATAAMIPPCPHCGAKSTDLSYETYRIPARFLHLIFRHEL